MQCDPGTYPVDDPFSMLSLFVGKCNAELQDVVHTKSVEFSIFGWSARTLDFW